MGCIYDPRLRHDFLALGDVCQASDTDLQDKWQFPFWNDETAKLKLDELFASDALLLGRVTYQEFAKAWPSITDEEGFANRMNSLPKFVASTTLKEPLEWNATLIKGNIAQEVSELKQQPGQDILISGGAGLVHSLMKQDLIDEYRLLTFPAILGTGKRLFGAGAVPASLTLVRSNTTGTGVVVSVYRRAGSLKTGSIEMPAANDSVN
jgi:dihydrofolate reductase